MKYSLREANYGQTPSTIQVEDIGITELRRFIRPVAMMYPGDKIVTSDGNEYIVGKELDSKSWETVNKGLDAPGTIKFSASKDIFATDNPNITVIREYDTFGEYEKITLMDKSGKSEEKPREHENDFKKKKKIKKK